MPFDCSMKKLVPIFSIVLLVSCQTRREKENPVSAIYSAEREIFYNYLSNRLATFEELAPGLTTFQSTLPNDPNRYSDYQHHDTKAAANTGVYMADLYYCILAQENDMSYKYFQSVAALSKTLGVEELQIDNLVGRYGKNLNNYDSLKGIATQLLKHTTLDLENDRERLAGIAMATYQIENLYLALSILESYPENPSELEAGTKLSLQAKVFSQRANLEIIYNFLRSITDPLDPQSNPNYPFYDAELRGLIGIYQQLDAENAGQAEIDPLKNQKTIAELFKNIKDLRTKIVSKE